MSNPFGEATHDVSLPELAAAIDVSDLLLLSLRAKVLFGEQYDQIRVRFDAAEFSSGLLLEQLQRQKSQKRPGAGVASL